MKRSVLFLSLAIACFGRAFGCSCDTLPPMDVEFARSDTVFVGRVVQMAVESRSEDNYRYEVRVCRFQISEGFKGLEDQKKEVTIVTRMSGSACGFPFELGERYLVYASVYHGELETSICRRTRVLVQPKEAAVVEPPPPPDPLMKKEELDESGRIEADRLREFLRKK